MSTNERHKPRPVLEAERRAEAAERRSASLEARAGTLQAALRRAETAERRAAIAEADATRDRATVARLTADIADVRQDRDRWRAQAERLATALDRLRMPTPVPVVPHAPMAAPAPAASGDDDLLHGMGSIAEFLRVTERQANHMKDRAGLPAFKLAGRVCARRSSLNTWLAQRETAAQQGGL